MHYDGGKAYYSDGTRVPEYSSEHGSAITGGASGGGLIAIIAVFLGAVVAGGFALLWFAISGYKTFNLGNLSRIIALGLSIAYGYIVYITFASEKSDLMILVYANIPIAIFFISAFIMGRKNGGKIITTIFIIILISIVGFYYYLVKDINPNNTYNEQNSYVVTKKLKSLIIYNQTFLSKIAFIIFENTAKSVSTIEGLRWNYNKIYGDESEYNISANTLIRIIENIKSKPSDLGSIMYLINKKTLKDLERGDYSVETSLKNYGQLNALYVYKRIKNKYR